MDDFDPTELKMAINNFLWERLPDSTTLKEAEDVATVIFEAITNKIMEAKKNQ